MIFISTYILVRESCQRTECADNYLQHCHCRFCPQDNHICTNLHTWLAPFTHTHVYAYVHIFIFTCMCVLCSLPAHTHNTHSTHTNRHGIRTHILWQILHLWRLNTQGSPLSHTHKTHGALHTQKTHNGSLHTHNTHGFFHINQRVIAKHATIFGAVSI